ncbi:pilus assembly protein [Novosphingobium sp. KCTC 2891]|uniref:TadE/TadG family type IV pilus assembly protein n=1 Tax=Novosphingobium sp. KCTC 2891 TaxID=2989730 RepID=UPI002223BEB8|nr:TadE/TadG family type IV pilus assembly protein [Novosphingobium sp. KCTC 2891]MCW1383493.1 pilus assembly protein [Novosphingobium sp. KCTC 2891]
MIGKSLSGKALGRAVSIKRLARSTRGNATVLMAVATPVLVSAAGFAIDTSQWFLWKREMQYAADQGAIGGAWSLAKGIVKDVYATHAQQEYTANLAVTKTFSATPTVALVNYNGGTSNAILVTATATRTLPFFGFVTGKSTTVKVSAQASFAKGATYTSCIIATNPTADGAITIGGSAVLKSGCGLAALSNSTNSIRVSGNPTIDVNYLMAAGGIDDWFDTHTDDVVKEYMTTLSDPFKSLTAPTTTATGSANTCVKSGGVTTATINPGNYTSISTACNTVMNPGIYVINGGTFTIRAQDVVTANGVMIVLKNGANFKINGGAALNLTAMTNAQLLASGLSSSQANALEGMLIMEDRNSAGNVSTLNGTSDSVINGTIYLPKSTMSFGGTARVTSRCLQITANMISIQGNVNMTSFCPPGLQTSTAVGTDAPKVILVA